MTVCVVMIGVEAVSTEETTGMVALGVALVVVVVAIVVVVSMVVRVAWRRGGGPRHSSAGVAGVRSSSLNSRK